MTDKQKKARKINWSLMQMESVITHLKYLKGMYPDDFMQRHLTHAIGHIEKVKIAAKVNRYGIFYPINWR